MTTNTEKILQKFYGYNLPYTHMWVRERERDRKRDL